jgi:PqqD family protein of HPr-rel-A system
MNIAINEKENVICRQEGDEAILFKPETGELWVLNGSGRMIWEILSKEKTISENRLSECLSETYVSADKEEISKTVQSFVADLQKLNLITMR